MYILKGRYGIKFNQYLQCSILIYAQLLSPPSLFKSHLKIMFNETGRMQQKKRNKTVYNLKFQSYKSKLYSHYGDLGNVTYSAQRRVNERIHNFMTYPNTLQHMNLVHVSLSTLTLPHNFQYPTVPPENQLQMQHILSASYY